MTLEMHPQRWGDPAEAEALPESVRTLVDAFIGTHDTPAEQQVRLPEPAVPDAALASLRAVIGVDAVLTDDRQLVDLVVYLRERFGPGTAWENAREEIARLREERGREE